MAMCAARLEMGLFVGDLHRGGDLAEVVRDVRSRGEAAGAVSGIVRRTGGTRAVCALALP